MDRGDTAVISLDEASDEHGEALDSTWDVELTAKESPSDTEAIFVKSTAPGDGIVFVAGRPEVTLDEADTAGVATTRALAFDAEARKDGRVITIEKGAITVLVDVTTPETVLVIDGGNAGSF